MTTTPRRAVVTALIGGHEQLLPQPVARDTDATFVCLTDDPDLRSDDWQLTVVEPLLSRDPVRSARALKITGHPVLEDYDETLWIDNRVRLTVDPHAVLDDWLADADLAVPRHSFRKDVVTEFQEVLLLGLDDSGRLYEQLHHYSATDPDLLLGPVPWTGLLARRRAPEVQSAMQRWLVHVLRYSRRDQLSFVQALHEAGVTPSWRELPNLTSDLHEWRQPVGRSRRRQHFQAADGLQPPIAEVGQLRLELERTVLELVGAVDRREHEIGALEARLAESAGLSDELATHRDRAESLDRELAAVNDARDAQAVQLQQATQQLRKARRNRRRAQAEADERARLLADVLAHRPPSLLGRIRGRIRRSSG